MRLMEERGGVKRRQRHGTVGLRSRENYRKGERFATLVGAPDNQDNCSITNKS